MNLLVAQRRFKRIEIPMFVAMQMATNRIGVCIACGAIETNVESESSNECCNQCGHNALYAVAEAAESGLIRIV